MGCANRGSDRLSQNSVAAGSPATAQAPVGASSSAETRTVTTILLAISVSHLLNDTVQSLFPAIYPFLKTSFDLSYTQIGLITLTFQLTASLLQPFVGYYTDLRPKPFSLPVGMGFSLAGLLLLAVASNFAQLLVSAALVGIGSSVFHPESSRVARMASGGRYGLAQSVFQVGGNAGSAIGPLLAAFIVIPGGQGSIAWFSLIALLAIGLLWMVGTWYRRQTARKPRSQGAGLDVHGLSSRRVVLSVTVLLVLTFSKFFYMACLTSYYTFFLIDKFAVSVQASQIYLFIFLAAVAAGTFFGGPLGDRFGRRVVIWISILGVLPFTVALPYADLFWTGVLTVIIGFLIASAFSTIVVFAQELVPGRVGMIAGIFFGVAFGMGGIGAAVLGLLADATSIELVFRLCSFLPLIGLLTAFLPKLPQRRFS
jgi:MFS transporter, FSR family, fosmidomycin resistance protein